MIMSLTPSVMLVGLVAIAWQASATDATTALSWSKFTKSCSRQLSKPLTRFYGHRPHPDLNMIASNALWQMHDENIAILPKWQPPGGNSTLETIPFLDTHVAVRFLGGVSNFSDATKPNCVDQIGKAGQRRKIWCDLVVRETNGSLTTRFDLIASRLDRYKQNNIDLMIVLDDVPWAFVNVTSEGCASYGCQYLPPTDPQEFANWVAIIARFVKNRYGVEYASRIRWRLGTEANGPRWTNKGEYYSVFVTAYKLTMKAITEEIPGAKVGASNWVEVVNGSGNLTKNGSDSFMYNFYNEIAADPSVPLNWVSVSHYGSGKKNFPTPDWVQRTPYGTRGAVEIEAMRNIANRPDATLEVQEWSILNNENHQPTWDPSATGTAWSAASVTTWVCNGADKIFHWETGTTLTNTSGDGRSVNFYEQWPWNMAFLELFLGGTASFTTYDLPGPAGNRTVTFIESVKDDEYLVLVAALGAYRNDTFNTNVSVTTSANALVGQGSLQVSQYKMDPSKSVVELVVKELSNNPGTLVHNDGLPYDFARLLTTKGLEYAQAPENLNRYWDMHAKTFQPDKFEGQVEQDPSDNSTTFHFEVTSPSVTVLTAKRF